jgi:ATP-dependent protease HslVU (ClpYQ) ATPase subunit
VVRGVSCVKRGLRGGEHAVGGSTGIVVALTYDGDMAEHVAQLMTEHAHKTMEGGAPFIQPVDQRVLDVVSYWADEVPGREAVRIITDFVEGR